MPAPLIRTELILSRSIETRINYANYITNINRFEDNSNSHFLKIEKNQLLQQEVVL